MLHDHVIPDDQVWNKFAFNINQSVTHHTNMLLLPCVYQLFNVACTLNDIYGLGCGQLVEMTVVLTSPEGILILRVFVFWSSTFYVIPTMHLLT